jgi:hypothetical protein
MLAIPMMSAEYERVFSNVKHFLTNARNRLNHNIIETNECLKYWFGKPAKKVDQKAETSEEAAEEAAEKASVTKIKKDNESETENNVIYEIDSDGEIV